MGQQSKNSSLNTTRIIFVVGFVISLTVSMGLIASGWTGYASDTIHFITGFLLAYIASLFLKGTNSKVVAWIVFIIATILSFVFIGGVAM